MILNYMPKQSICAFCSHKMNIFRYLYAFFFGFYGHKSMRLCEPLDFTATTFRNYCVSRDMESWCTIEHVCYWMIYASALQADGAFKLRSEDVNYCWWLTNIVNYTTWFGGKKSQIEGCVFTLWHSFGASSIYGGPI